MPGASGHVSAAHIYNVAARDGTVIGTTTPGVITEPLWAGEAGRAKYKYDPTKLDPSRQRAGRDLQLLCPRRRAGEDHPGRDDDRGDPRRQRRRRLHARRAGAAQQRARHQIPRRHRLSGHARDPGRDGAQRGARRLRHGLGRDVQPAPGLDREGLHPRAGAGEPRRQSAVRQDGRAALRSTSPRPPEARADHRARLYAAGVRPALYPAARHAAGSRRGAAQGVHGGDADAGAAGRSGQDAGRGAAAVGRGHRGAGQQDVFAAARDRRPHARMR